MSLSLTDKEERDLYYNLAGAGPFGSDELRREKTPPKTQQGPLTNTSGINPVDVKVLFLPDPVEEKTKGGIILADSTREKSQYATIKGVLVGIGPNAFLEWGGVNNRPVAGQRVVTAQYAGLNIEGADGQKYRLCNDEDIIAVLKEGQ